MTQTRSRGLTGNFGDEAIIQTTDFISGFKSVSSRPGMNMIKQQSWRSDLKESQVDPPEVDKNRGSMTAKAPESAIWRSFLWPRNTGMVT